MNSLSFIGNQSFPAFFPDDLTEWLGATAVLNLAREAAELFYWVEAESEEHISFNGCRNPLRKLALLTYCYATGIYGTCEIQSRSVTDQSLRNLCGGANFPGEKLRLFRGHNSELLKLCLAHVLRCAWCARSDQSYRCSTVIDSSNHALLAGRLNAHFREFFASEADERLHRSIQADEFVALAKSNSPVSGSGGGSSRLCLGSIAN
jgi:hypothetical protein